MPGPHMEWTAILYLAQLQSILNMGQGSELWQRPRHLVLLQRFISMWTVHPSLHVNDSSEEIHAYWLIPIWLYQRDKCKLLNASAHNTDTEAEIARKDESRKGKGTSHIFSCISFLPNAYMTHLQSGWKCQLLSWKVLLSPRATLDSFLFIEVS
jgi:hypothetical protein